MFKNVDVNSDALGTILNAVDLEPVYNPLVLKRLIKAIMIICFIVIVVL